MTPVLDILEHLSETGGGKKFELSAAFDWLKTATKETTNVFLGKDTRRIYHCTVGPGDVLWVPPAYAFFERISSNDFVGVRRPVILAKDQPIFDAVNRYLLAVKKPHSGVQKTLDCLVLNQA